MTFDAEIESHLDRAKQRILERFGSDPNVTGVGFAYRVRGGERTDEPVVVVLVAKKRPEALVSRRRIRTILHRRGHPVRRITGGDGAAHATPLDELVFTHPQGDLRQVEHLPPLHADPHRARQQDRSTRGG